MAQKDTLEDFIRKAKAKHGDKYGYSKVKYVNNTTDVEIYCKTCGIYFWQPPKLHKRHGCSDCGRRSMIEKQRKSQEQFIKDLIAVHMIIPKLIIKVKRKKLSLNVINAGMNGKQHLIIFYKDVAVQNVIVQN